MKLLCLLFIYFVQFTDKQGSEPILFSERAIEQRERWNIKTDSLDYAVSPVYLDSLQHLGATILHTSRWMNGATIKIAYPHPLPEGTGEEDDIISKILACSFVDTVYLTRDEVPMPLAPKWERGVPADEKRASVGVRRASADDKLGSEEQLGVYNLNALHEAGYKGQGIVMAVIDGGFQNANTLHCFDSVRSQILGHYDFTDDTGDFFGETGPHGSMCLSTIAGLTDTYSGAATEAQYYMMRSEEYLTESPKELDNLVVAMEKADSLGVNILSISLGYAEFDNPNFNFTYADMNGRVSRASRAATIAARKGILVCNAMGNEGNKENWKYLTAPADADSILSVGAVGVDSTIAAFSSYGPSADGRVKPEACAVGYQTVIVNPSTGLMRKGNGTSFACPLIAGLSACVWSAHPDETAMQIRQRIINSAHKLDNPDDRYGYGIPDAMKAAGVPVTTESLKLKVESLKSSARKVLENGQIVILINGERYTLTGMKKG
ncbi:MAG: S8 family serine peptidase [Paludibacteraceae bacterium]|nr:S8 family serine peptidase [Paludibacteraceae bacterium]